MPIKINKNQKDKKKCYTYECEVCEGIEFYSPKFYCRQCEQEMCPSCTGELMKCREGIFEGETVCSTCYSNPEFEEEEEEPERVAVCPPVNKKALRTFVNLGIDPKTADRFKLNDNCDRCDHFFKRGMIKEYHYASKNCMKQTPYSETEKGQAGKGGEHTARKARKAADPTRETTKAITAWRKTNQLKGIFTYKNDKAKQQDWDTLYDNLVDIPKFLGWIVNNLDDAKKITSMDWDADTNRLLNFIKLIELNVEKQKTTVSLGGVELGSKGGGEEFITVGDFMNWEY
tara:strand:+ start:537 stop:1397 length:861 start_codon:yes stop_codon:yes gene_type:complete